MSTPATYVSRIAEIRAYLASEDRAKVETRHGPVWEDDAIRDLLAHIKATDADLKLAHAQGLEQGATERRQQQAQIEMARTALEHIASFGVPARNPWHYMGVARTALVQLSAPSQPETPKTGEWQPIETLPKDRKYEVLVRFDKCYEPYVRIVGPCAGHLLDQSRDNHVATHWQLLPSSSLNP